VTTRRRDDPEDLLVEATLGAYRALGADGMPLPTPAWSDLSPESRERAYRLQCLWRRLEQEADPQGYNSTVRAVLARIGADPER
jgi:hypothetical protein